MQLFFGDDSRQPNPSRQGMGALLAAGGFCVAAVRAKSLEIALKEVCREFGFPEREEFKWSPGRELWMREALVGQERADFFQAIIDKARQHEITAFVAVVDTRYRSATGASSHEEDVTRLLLERVQNYLSKASEDGIVIVDRPTGDRNAETKFLRSCLETFNAGTAYVRFDRIAFNVVSTPSSLIRMLQLADVITGCSLARISGESRFSPPLFDRMRNLFYSEPGRTGGLGVKIHPDSKYVNLYHWLLGDKRYVRMGTRFSLPYARKSYSQNELQP